MPCLETKAATIIIRALKNSKVVDGSAAIQTELSCHLCEYARTIAARLEPVVNCFVRDSEATEEPVTEREVTADAEPAAGQAEGLASGAPAEGLVPGALVEAMPTAMPLSRQRRAHINSSWATCGATTATASNCARRSSQPRSSRIRTSSRRSSWSS